MSEKREDYSPRIIFGKNKYPDGTVTHYVTGYNLNIPKIKW